MTNNLSRLLGVCLIVAASSVLAAGSAKAADHIAWIEDFGLRPGVPLVSLPPAAGAIIGIDEQRKSDSYIQIITLQGDRKTVGENQIIATVTRNGLAPRIEQDKLASEMQERLPDMALDLGPPDTRNAFGIFGAAVGSKGSLNCIYGWQGVSLADRLITGKTASPLDEQHALSIRFRLCRSTISTVGLSVLLAGAQSGSNAAGVLTGVAGGRDALSAAASLDPGTAALSVGPPALPNFSPRDGTVVENAPVRRHVARPARHRVRQPLSQSPSEETTQAPRMPMAGMPSVPLPQ